MIVAAAVKSLPAEQRRRVHPFLTGFNPTDKNADAHIRRMLELDPGLWQGIGEIFTRHDDLTALTYGDVPRANNEALARVYHLAAEFDLPVLLHANVTSKRERNPLYLAEIEEPCAITRMCGSSGPMPGPAWRSIATRRNWTSSCRPRLLQRYPNLYIDLSWSVLRPYLLDEQGKPDPQWLALVERFPQRFMLGSDVVGQFDSLPELMASFDPFLDALPEQVARQVARDNFLAVLPRQPADPRGE